MATVPVSLNNLLWWLLAGWRAWNIQFEVLGWLHTHREVDNCLKNTPESVQPPHHYALHTLGSFNTKKTLSGLLPLHPYTHTSMVCRYTSAISNWPVRSWIITLDPSLVSVVPCLHFAVQKPSLVLNQSQEDSTGRSKLCEWAVGWHYSH